MVQVKTFVPKDFNSVHFAKLDEANNSFIAENKIKVVDIKYSSSLSFDSGRSYFLHSAMLIYETIEE